MKMTVNISELEQIAKDFSKNLKTTDTACVVGLSGDLGSGKTTFTQMLAKILGVKENVTSPTFVIEKIYPTSLKQLRGTSVFERLIHIDAYRLESGKELLQLGWKEIVSNPKNLIIIEWPERVADILPENLQKIGFKFIDENTREVIL